MIEANLIEEILKRADIVDVISSYITVIKKGRNYVAVCPFHDDKNPSMMISKDKQIFKCFVCGTGGNAITFIQKFENIPFDNAVRKLADFIGYNDSRLNAVSGHIQVDETKERLFKTEESLIKFYEMSLSATEGESGVNYLKARNIDSEVINYFHIGYCPSNPTLSIKYLQASGNSLKDMETIGVAGHSNGQYIDKNAGRVIFPIQDSNGRFIGSSARKIVENDEPKYVNSPETPIFQKGNVLYNYHNARKTSRLDGYCYLLEGFMDVIALHRAGINSAVALMGTAMTKTQINLLRKLNVEIRICLDSDNAGQSATLKLIEAFDKNNMRYRIVRRSTGPKDADEILNEFGKDNLIKWLNILIDKIQFALNYYSSNNKLSSIDERKQFIYDFIPYLINVTNELELSEYISNIAKITGFDYKIIAKELDKIRNKGKYDDAKSFQIQEQRTLHRLELTERALIYQMMHSQKAIEFYIEKNVIITDTLFSKIANYIVEYIKTHNKINTSDLINYVAQSEDPLHDKIVSELTDLSLERHYPQCSDALLDEYLKIINEERNKKYEQFIFEKSSKGKTEKEKLKILLERSKKKNERLNKSNRRN